MTTWELTPALIAAAGLMFYSFCWVSSKSRRHRQALQSMATTVTLDARDMRYYAGTCVAVDCDTNETITSAADFEKVKAFLKLRHPERRCFVVRVPLTASGPIHILDAVGPYTFDDDDERPDWDERW